MRILYLFTFVFIEIFHHTTFAAHKENTPAFNFEPGYFSNSDKLKEADEFFSTNAKNVIIIVDDNSLLRRGLQLRLQREGYAVFTLSQGDYLLQILREKIFGSMIPNARLIVLDNQMPGMNGVDVMAAITAEMLLKAYLDKNAGDLVPVVLNSDEGYLAANKDMLKPFRKVLSRKNSISEILAVLKCNYEAFRRGTI